MNMYFCYWMFENWIVGCMAYCVGLGLGYAWPYHEQVSSWLVTERVVNMSGEVHISDTLVW